MGQLESVTPREWMAIVEPLNTKIGVIDRFHLAFHVNCVPFTNVWQLLWECLREPGWNDLEFFDNGFRGFSAFNLLNLGPTGLMLCVK